MTATQLTDAARMPVAFAQVREDPRVDLAVLDLLGRPDATGIMIASGGCTATALVASERFGQLHLVDVNPAQLALTRLKLHLLCNAGPGKRLELLGHAPLASREEELAAVLGSLGLGPNVLGPLALVAQLGPDHAGRYEMLFACLREALGAYAESWPIVLSGPNASAESAPTTPLGRALDDAFDRVMALENLVALFGREATQNSIQPFARHFAGRTRQALAMTAAAQNPFLWQLLAGRFPAGHPYDWLMLPPPTRLLKLEWTNAPMDAVLAGIENRFDFVHLSNILDWLADTQAASLLRSAHRSMKPGGLMILRQLNSSLDLPALGPEFDWLQDEASTLHAGDRSFFYRHLHLARRR